MVNTPILFVTFARPQYARQVFDVIRANKPKKLYFYSNKARLDRPEEIQRNEEIRSWAKEVDWDCELHTFFRDDYVDIYASLKGALDWVFSCEPEAIVLEDDCVPTSAFFSFCDQMIDRYRENNKVWCVSGVNYLDYVPKDADYFFSQYHFMYGWASWRSRWEQIRWGDLPVDTLLQSNHFNELFKTRWQTKYRKRELKGVKKFVNETNCWDYAIGIEMDYHHAVTVHPKEHLVTCVGMIGEHSYISQETMFHKRSVCKDDTYLIKHHPKLVEADMEYDYLFFVKYEKYIRLYNRVWRRFKAYLSKFFR